MLYSICRQHFDIPRRNKKMLNLKNKAQKVNQDGSVPFMEGREKADLMLDEILTIDDYGFINGKDGEYVVLSCLEYPKFFFFGGSVVTQKVRALIDGESEQEVKELLSKFGLTTQFTEKKSKASNRTYMTCEFYATKEEEK